MAKIYCNEMSIRVTSEAIQVHGGYGFTDEYPVSRFFRGTRYGSLGGGTSETLRNLVGRKLVRDMDLATGVLGMGMFLGQKKSRLPGISSRDVHSVCGSRAQVFLAIHRVDLELLDLGALEHVEHDVGPRIAARPQLAIKIRVPFDLLAANTDDDIAAREPRLIGRDCRATRASRSACPAGPAC